jgi:hypothetical protein
LVGLGVGDALGDSLVGLGVGDGVALGDDDGDGELATVRVVTHELLGSQRPPCGAAAVVSVAPPDAVDEMVAPNVTVVEVGPPETPKAGNVQMSAFWVVLKVKLPLASSEALLAIVALPSSPVRSSITVVPAALGAWALTCSEYRTVAPGCTVLPDAGCTVAVTVSGALGDADAVAVKPANAATIAAVTPRASHCSPLRGKRVDLPKPRDTSRTPTSIDCRGRRRTVHLSPVCTHRAQMRIFGSPIRAALRLRLGCA